MLNDTQVLRPCQTFANGSLDNIELSKTQLSKIVQLGGFLEYLGVPEPSKTTETPVTLAHPGLGSYKKELIKKDSAKWTKDLINFLVHVGDNNLSKGSGLTLPNNEIKDVMRVIKSLENKGILLKGTTRKIISQEKRFLRFLGPLLKAGLS